MHTELHYPSLTALAAHAAQTGPSEHSRDSGEEHFFGCSSMEEALAMARTGWPEGTTKAKQLLERLNADNPTENVYSATYLDVSGSYVDIGEYVQGTPECMVQFREDSRAARFVRIVVCASYSCNFTVEQAIMRGVAIAALVDRFESMGIRCDIDSLVYVGNHSNPADRFSVTVPVKAATEPLNLDRVVFALAHPAYFRRLIFALMELQPAQFRNLYGVRSGGGYGRIVEFPKFPDAIVFPTPSASEDWDENYALKKIRSCLDTFLEAQKKKGIA